MHVRLLFGTSCKSWFQTTATTLDCKKNTDMHHISKWQSRPAYINSLQCWVHRSQCPSHSQPKAQTKPNLRKTIDHIPVTYLLGLWFPLYKHGRLWNGRTGMWTAYIMLHQPASKMKPLRGPMFVLRSFQLSRAFCHALAWSLFKRSITQALFFSKEIANCLWSQAEGPKLRFDISIVFDEPQHHPSFGLSLNRSRTLL